MYKTLNTNSDKKIGHYLINLKLSRIGKLEVRRQKGEYAGYIKKKDSNWLQKNRANIWTDQKYVTFSSLSERSDFVNTYIQPRRIFDIGTVGDIIHWTQPSSKQSSIFSDFFKSLKTYLGVIHKPRGQIFGYFLPSLPPLRGHLF